MKLFRRVKDYVAGIAAVAGSFFGDGYNDSNVLSAERSIAPKRVNLPVTTRKYNSSRWINQLLDSRLDLTRDTTELNKTLDLLVSRSDSYFSTLGSSSLSELDDQLSKKAGAIRTAYKTNSDALGREANDLARKLEQTVINIERADLKHDLDVVENGLTGDSDEVMRSLRRMENRADRYAELLNDKDYSHLMDVLEGSRTSIIKAYQNSDNFEFRSVIDMYKRTELSLKDARHELKEDQKSDYDLNKIKGVKISDQDPDLLGVK